LVGALGEGTSSLVDAYSYQFVLVVGVFAVVGASTLAYRADVMTLSGAVAGSVLGVVVLVAGGWGWFVVLGGLVFLGAVSTGYARDEKESMGLADHDYGRGYRSVAANGVVAGGCALGYGLAPSGTAAGVFAVGFVGALATATADTTSSEIGCVAGDPYLVTTFERVPPGTDGGVSVVGEVVTAAGATALAVLAVVLGVVTPESGFFCALGGVMGAHVDSYLGATVEGEYIGNEGVNFSATLSGAAVAALLFVLV